MLKKSRRLISLFLLLMLFLTGCSFSAQVEPTIAPSDTPIPPTETVAPPTTTETLVPPTVTPTKTLEPTATNTATSTPVPPSLVVSVDLGAVCRTGPDLNFAIAGYLPVGNTPALLARSETDPVWWQVELTENAVTCWVSDLVVTVEGDVESLPQITPPPIPTAASVSAQAGSGIYYFVTSTDSGGPFGCEKGDSLLYVFTGKSRTGILEDDVATALNALFSNHNQYYNGLYNPMYASSLRVGDVDFSPGDPEAYIWLAGDFVRPKDKCESQRMHDQVWETVEIQFPEISHAVIRVHNALLGDLLVVNK